MTTSQVLLGLLSRAPAYGYTLKRDYDQVLTPDRPLAFGQVYSALSRFERQGWAELMTVESGAGPDRKLYCITSEGVQMVEDWISTPQESGGFGTSALFARVSIALLSGRDAADVLEGQRGSHLRRMRLLTARRRDADARDLLAIDYELTHMDADLRWIEEAGPRLDALAIRLSAAVTSDRGDER